MRAVVDILLAKADTETSTTDCTIVLSILLYWYGNIITQCLHLSLRDPMITPVMFNSLVAQLPIWRHRARARQRNAAPYAQMLDTLCDQNISSSQFHYFEKSADRLRTVPSIISF